MKMQDIVNAINEAHEKYGYYYFGVRTADVLVKVGDECERSRDWDYESDQFSDELLSGTCCTGIGWLDFDSSDEDINNIKKAIEFNTNSYTGNTVYIIGGNRETAGMDENESIIDDACVIYVIK